MNAVLERAVAVMSGFGLTWGVAGGWAVDLFLNRDSRTHVDIDLAVLRRDQMAVRSWVAAARVEKVTAGGTMEWLSSERLEEPIHEVHVTWPDGFEIEFLLNECDEGSREWVFRRDPRVSKPLAEAFLGRPGVPYLAPEIVLLYKSKAPSARDETDLASALPHLEGKQRAWLYEALQVTSPGHHWASTILREP
jgi:hypothetical protein